jgi:hypothetical protein
MPAGIPKRLTDELGKLGVTLDPYHVAGTARLGGIGPAVPVGRNCPDCCAVSAIPEDWRVLPTTNRRRIVYRRRRSK